jgi:hypothetical protein
MSSKTKAKKTTAEVPSNSETETKEVTKETAKETTKETKETVKANTPKAKPEEDATVEEHTDEEQPAEDAEVEVEEDAEADPEDEAEAEEEPDEKPAKPTKKTVAKGKVVAKKGGKAPAKGGKKKADAAKNAETIRYNNAWGKAVEASYVTKFDGLVPRSYHDRCANALTMFILHTINDIQTHEVVDENSYNPYPASSYLLLEDKMDGTTASAGKSVKTKGGKTTDASKPTKKRLPIKRGQKAPVEEKPVEAEESTEADEPEETEATDDKTEDSEEKTEEKTEEKKTKPKKNIVTMSRNAKTYIAFIVCRFVDELYSTEGGKNIRSDADFVKFVMENISKDVKSQITRVIIPTVKRMERCVASMPDFKFAKDVTTKIEDGGIFDDRPAFKQYIQDYLMKYFKLMGLVIGHDLWVTHKGISGSTIEKAMRILSFGNYEYMCDIKLVNDGESDFGITQGILEEVRGFDKLLNPPVSDEVKAERAAKRAANKGKPKDPKAPAAKTKAPAKAKKGAAKGKTKKTKVDEPAEEVEAEEETEEVAEEAEAEEETEEVAEEETEAVEEEVEEEAKPAPKLKKPLRKL